MLNLWQLGLYNLRVVELKAKRIGDCVIPI
jgi:hypothetical protein